MLDAVTSMRQVCGRYGTTLATAALQFSLRDSRFATTVVGMSRPERVQATLDAASVLLPEDLWAELDELLPPARAVARLPGLMPATRTRSDR